MGSRRVSLAIPSGSPGGVSEELEGMVADTLEGLGFEVKLVPDGDAGGLETDLLLLFREVLNFPGFGRLLGRSRSQPLTVLWQLDPLPPPELDLEGERSAVARGHLSERMRLPSTLKRLIPTPLKTAVRNNLSKVLFSDKALVDRWPERHRDLDPISQADASRRYSALKRHVHDGLIDRIFTSAPAGVEFLRSRGIDSEFVPFGYHPAMGTDLDKERDVDVVFLGKVKGRRRERILNEVSHTLEQLGSRLTVVDRNCFGAERNELLNRARITLNVPNYAWHLSGIRFLMAMGCDSLVVSEGVEDFAPFEPGTHFAAAEDDLAGVVAHFLEHDDQRQSLARSGHGFVTAEHTLTRAISTILEKCGLIQVEKENSE